MQQDGKDTFAYDKLHFVEIRKEYIAYAETKTGRIKFAGRFPVRIYGDSSGGRGKVCEKTAEDYLQEELRQFLNYMEKTTRENAVNKELQEIQQMVEQVKTDEGVSIEYMKSFERDLLMRKEGREEERLNTERERKRAEKAEEKAAEAEARIKQLEEELERIKRGSIL